VLEGGGGDEQEQLGLSAGCAQNHLGHTAVGFRAGEGGVDGIANHAMFTGLGMATAFRRLGGMNAMEHFAAASRQSLFGVIAQQRLGGHVGELDTHVVIHHKDWCGEGIQAVTVKIQRGLVVARHGNILW
jgi:hypothetical protein